MRDVRFKARPAPAPKSGPWKHAPLDRFALRLSTIRHALAVKRTIPSLEDFNQEFMKGINDLSMSGGTEWKPFTITEERSMRSYVKRSPHTRDSA
jgi:hypothetical protein